MPAECLTANKLARKQTYLTARTKAAGKNTMQYPQQASVSAKEKTFSSAKNTGTQPKNCGMPEKMFFLCHVRLRAAAEHKTRMPPTLNGGIRNCCAISFFYFFSRPCFMKGGKKNGKLSYHPAKTKKLNNSSEAQDTKLCRPLAALTLRITVIVYIRR
jgi:hypothetical protein